MTTELKFADLRPEILRVVGRGATHVIARKGDFFFGSTARSGVWVITIYDAGWKIVERWAASAPMFEESAWLAALQHFRVQYGRPTTETSAQ